MTYPGTIRDVHTVAAKSRSNYTRRSIQKKTCVFLSIRPLMDQAAGVYASTVSFLSANRFHFSYFFHSKHLNAWISTYYNGKIKALALNCTSTTVGRTPTTSRAFPFSSWIAYTLQLIIWLSRIAVA